MSTRSARLLLAVALALPACRELATDSSLTPNLKPGPTGPGYTMVTMNLPPGYTSATATRINGVHRVVGNASGMTGRGARALYWDAAITLTPVLLPELAGTTVSEVGGISDNGIVGGRMNDTAVLWVPSGGTWTIVPLPGGTCSRARGVASDQTAVGLITLSQWCTDGPIPAVWDPAGAVTQLPFPAGGRWTTGEAFAINAQGDISGTFEEHLGATYVYGALWIRAGTGYLPMVMQTGPAYGLSDRTPDGKIHVIATNTRSADRFTFTPNGDGTWSRDSLALPGLANDVNAVGDVSGIVPKLGFGAYGAGYPFITTISGVTTRLPIPKNASAVGQGISDDQWVTGVLGGQGVVWKLNP